MNIFRISSHKNYYYLLFKNGLRFNIFSKLNGVQFKIGFISTFFLPEVQTNHASKITWFHISPKTIRMKFAFTEKS